MPYNIIAAVKKQFWMLKEMEKKIAKHYNEFLKLYVSMITTQTELDNLKIAYQQLKERMEQYDKRIANQKGESKPN